ncbi:MAG TPA: hypothetical protein VNF99_07885 [Stellaceae bacterium]|nr:hypothetical protein [Stellaceae bacterium]
MLANGDGRGFDRNQGRDRSAMLGDDRGPPLFRRHQKPGKLVARLFRAFSRDWAHRLNLYGPVQFVKPPADDRLG